MALGGDIAKNKNHKNKKGKSMEQFPTSTPEAAQGVAPQAEQGMAETGAAEALSAPMAAGLGEAALNAVMPEAPAAEATATPGAEASTAVDLAVGVAPMPEVQAVNTTPAPEAGALAEQPVAGGEVNVAIETVAVTPGTETAKSPEGGKVSDTEMVDYILGRLRDDSTLPDVKEHPEKADEIGKSIGIFEQTASVLNDDKRKNKEPISAEVVLAVIASENRYMADKSQNEAEKTGHEQMARLADEWADSYANRKARLEAERAGGEQANVAAEGAAVPAENQNQTAAGLVPEAAPAAAAAPTGEQVVGAEQAPAISPANAGGTTQPSAVPLSTEDIV